MGSLLHKFLHTRREEPWSVRVRSGCVDSIDLNYPVFDKKLKAFGDIHD